MELLGVCYVEKVLLMLDARVFCNKEKSIICPKIKRWYVILLDIFSFYNTNSLISLFIPILDSEVRITKIIYSRIAGIAQTVDVNANWYKSNKLWRYLHKYRHG